MEGGKVTIIPGARAADIRQVQGEIGATGWMVGQEDHNIDGRPKRTQSATAESDWIGANERRARRRS